MIWRRYFLKELAKVFLLFIGGFYFLYVLIDYSTHTRAFHQESVRLIDIISYYLFQFTKRADILVPIALLISTVKVLTTSNMRNEIVALVSGGLPIRQLVRPFLFAGAICTAFLYLNFQFLQPRTLNALTSFEESYFKDRSTAEPIGALPLSDNSLLIYQRFDTESQSFTDVYWYKDHDLIYRMEKLYPFEATPLGINISILKREEGQLKRTHSFETHAFPGIIFDRKSLFTAIHPPRSQSLSQLFSNLPWRKTLTDREAEAATVFLYKLTIPLACLLVVFAPAPFCVRFGRHLPVFAIYALSLFGIITFFTFVNSCVILGESQVIHPFIAILTPLALFFGLFGWKYAKLY